MSEMVVTFPGGKRVDAAFDNFVVRTDQPLAQGGLGSAPEPFSLFLASLATCAGIYVLGFCQARGIPTDEIRLVEQSSYDGDGKLAEIRLRIDLPAGFPEKYVGAARAAASGCKVKKLLAAPPNISVEVTRVAESSTSTARIVP